MTSPTTISLAPSPSASSIVMHDGLEPVVIAVAAPNVPPEDPARTLIPPALASAVARSTLPSPSTSPAAMEIGPSPTVICCTDPKPPAPSLSRTRTDPAPLPGHGQRDISERVSIEVSDHQITGLVVEIDGIGVLRIQARFQSHLPVLKLGFHHGGPRPDRRVLHTDQRQVQA